MAKDLPVSPLAPPGGLPILHPVPGVDLAGRAMGLKRSGKRDLMLMRFAEGTSVAGTFTKSRCPSAPVDWCRKHLDQGQARALVVNSGNANAFTGTAGDTTVTHTAAKAAELLGCPAEQVFQASTGVIGEPREADYIASKLPEMARSVGPDGWADAAEAIRTTDTFAKAASTKVKIGGTEATLTGIAKGSGMIAPDMATMLSFVATDAKIPAPVLQKLVGRGVDRSFNSITVDSDTSTSDTVLVFATGQADHPVVETGTERFLGAFKRALDAMLIDLAHQIVRDGEGATKFVEIAVTGAVSRRSAKKIGLSIANSPLVKTAIAGEDANWGRIVMAVGKAGEPADRDLLSIAVGGVPITERGQVVEGYDEAPVAAHMKGQDIKIALDLGLRRGKATVWTCDLTHGYISINGDYRS